ncbi:MAG TPA: anion permease [Micromonosporaceae bacterium]
MSAELIAVIAVILVAMMFDYTNGFHDAANAIATSVSTRALTPRVALLVAAVGNFIGAHFGESVAKTVGAGLVTLPPGLASLGVVFAGVLGAIGWNLLTWYFGIPSSSSHALFGGLVGATLFAAGGHVQWGNITQKVVLPMVLSPVVGILLGAVVMFGLLWTIKGLTVVGQRSTRAATSTTGAGQSVAVPEPAMAGAVGARREPGDAVAAGTGPSEPTGVDGDTPEPKPRLGTRIGRSIHGSVQPGPLNRVFRWLQVASATAMAVGHGMQDAAKTMGIVVLALYTGGLQDSKTHIPGWVYYASATVLALGTYAGGWRIIRTLGRRIIHLDPPQGFAAETVASSVLYYNALVLGAPISTTHTITSAIMGVGATKRISAVRWGVAGNIVTAWVLTFPGAAAIAVLAYFLTRPLF